MGFLQAIIDVLVSPVMDKLAATKETVTLALFLWLLVEKFDVHLEINSIQFLCQCLLIRPDKSNTACADLESIDFHFPANMANKRLSASRVQI